MNQDPFSHRIPQLFWKCLLFSFAVHFLFIAVLYWQPFWVAKWFSVLPHPFTHKTVAYHGDTEMLDGVFDDLIVIAHNKNLAFDTPRPYEENGLPLLENNVVPLERPQPVLTPFNPYLTEQTDGLLIQEPIVDPSLVVAEIKITHPVISFDHSDLAAIELPSLESSSIAKEHEQTKDHLPQEQPIESIASGIAQERLPCVITPVQELYSAQTLTPKLEEKEILGNLNIPSSKALFSKDSAVATQTYGLPNFSKGEDWHHLFHVDVQIMPRKEQEGIFFAVTLIPKPEAALRSLKQHFHFVVDCSKTTDKYRVSVYKKALERALTYLQDGHTFNIYFVDQGIQTLSKEPLTVSRKAMEQAKGFLDKHTTKGYGTKASLISLLEEISINAEEHLRLAELDTVVLLTDGMLLQEAKQRKQPVREWLKDGPPPFVLYAATIGSDSHPGILDALAASSGGKVLHSSTNAAFPRKFAKLMLDIKTPIAMQVSPQLLMENQSTAISLMGTCCKMSPLFASQPTTFFGAANGPTDFTLYLAGMTKDHPVELNFKIDLKSSRQGAMTFQQIALQDKAQHELSLYLQNGEEAHFHQAIEWLEDASQLRRHR